MSRPTALKKKYDCSVEMIKLPAWLKWQVSINMIKQTLSGGMYILFHNAFSFYFTYGTCTIQICIVLSVNIS